MESIFENIIDVRGPVTLVAFLLALVTYAYRRWLLFRLSVLEAIPMDERVDYLERQSGDYLIRTADGLASGKKFELLMMHMRNRARRFGLICGLLFFIGLLALFSMEKHERMHLNKEKRWKSSIVIGSDVAPYQVVVDGRLLFSGAGPDEYFTYVGYRGEVCKVVIRSEDLVAERSVSLEEYSGQKILHFKKNDFVIRSLK